MTAREDADALENKAHTRTIPRRAEGGASAPPDPPAIWIVDPPRGTPFDKREFASLREAGEHANTCPPRTRIIYPSQQEGTYENYLASFHGQIAALSRDEWQRKHEFEQSELARKIDHYGAQLDADRAEVQSILLDSTAPLVAADFCAEAARLVGGPRAATHGDKTINFQNIAELWNGYWRIKCRVAGEPPVTPFTAHDIGCMMELFKIARRFSGSFNADDYIDAAGYAGCTGEIAAKDAARDESLRKT